MNKVTLIGRLTKDVDFKYVGANNTPLARYSLAVERKFKKDGQPEVDFINCQCWGKSAEFVTNYFNKGMRVAVNGRIETGSYEKDDGTRVYTTTIITEEHHFADGKRESIPDSREPAPNEIKKDDGEFYPVEEDKDELPF